MRHLIFIAVLVAFVSGIAEATTVPPRLDGARSPSTEGFYPTDMRDQGIKGSVVLSACVDGSGVLTQPPSVVESSGHPSLDAAAVSWASQSTYIGGTKDGQPTNLCTKFRVKFEINTPKIPTEPTALSAYLETFIADFNNTAPQLISDDIQIDKIERIGPRKIEYTYTFRVFGSNPSDEQRINSVADNIEKNSLPTFCGPDGFANFLDSGVIVAVAFQDSQERPIVTLTLDKDFCGNVLASAKKRANAAVTASTPADTRPVVLLRAPRSEEEARMRWPITSGLLDTRSTHITLGDVDREPYVRIATGWLRSLVSVHQRLSDATGVSAPCIEINSNPGINAYAQVGQNSLGCIGFTLGMLEFLQDDHDQIAAVTAHELGHMKFRHTGRNDRQGTARVLGSLLGMLVGGQISNQITSTLASQAAQYATRAVVFSFDRTQEREADDFALTALEQAGYSRDSFSKFMSRLSVRPGANDGGIFATHPSYSERISRTTEKTSP